MPPCVCLSFNIICVRLNSIPLNLLIVLRDYVTLKEITLVFIMLVHLLFWCLIGYCSKLPLIPDLKHCLGLITIKVIHVWNLEYILVLSKMISSLKLVYTNGVTVPDGLGLFFCTTMLKCYSASQLQLIICSLLWVCL